MIISCRYHHIDMPYIIYIYIYHLHAFMWSLATCVSHSTLNLTGFRTNGPYWWWRPHPCASCGGTRTFRKQFGLVGKGVRLWDLQNWGFEFRWWGNHSSNLPHVQGPGSQWTFATFFYRCPRGVMKWCWSDHLVPSGSQLPSAQLQISEMHRLHRRLLDLCTFVHPSHPSIV